MDLVSRNVADLAERPVKVNYTPNHYSVDKANEMLEKLHGHWLWLPVLLSLFYGLRRSEVLGLQWKSIDFTNDTILIQHARIHQEINDQEVTVGRDILKRKSSYRTLPRVSVFVLIILYGHSFTVASLRAGDDIKTVQGNLGHYAAAFMLDVYGHVTEEMKQDSADRMEQYIRGISNL